MQSVNPLDEAAFTELYVQHVDAVYRICYSFLKNRTDAEDAVQETFLRLMQSQKPLENDAHLRGWLVVTASNVCKNMLHSWLWQKRQEVEDWEEVLKSDNQTPEETAVLKALMQLPEKYKTVLYLYYYEEYSCKEIAEMMQKKESTVRSLLKRGREALQKKIGGDGYAAGLESHLDEAAKERMKQAILQKMQAETPQTASKKPPFFLQRCSFGTFARAAALCCMTVTVALAGLHLTDRRTAELLPAPSVSEQSAETTTPHTLPAQTTTTLQVQTTTKTQTTLQTTASAAKQTVTASKTTAVQTVEPPSAIIEEPDAGIEEPPEEPIQTEPICTEPAPVLTTTAVETNAIEEPETTTTTFRGVATYGSLFDFQYARWNGVHYQTDYSAVSYEDLDDLAGFSVAIQSESDRVYTILVYPLKGYPIQDCIAVQYAGDSDYFYFYAIS